MERIETVAGPNEQGLRLDRVLSDLCAVSRTMAQQLIEDGNVLVNGKTTSKSLRLEAGDILSVIIPPPRESKVLPQEIPLDIVYEDAHLLVVDKPKGMVVHPAPGNYEDTLVNALLYHCEGALSGIGGEIRPGIVHRIDKDTSGLLVVAKDDVTHNGLAEQFAAHSITRKYEAMVYGRFSEDAGIINKPIGRSKADRKKMTVTYTNSKQAVTTYEVIATYPGFTHLALRLQTGRTHQIRVHMAQAGHPVAGDPVYGPKKVIKSLHGQCLHAGVLGFVHPVSGVSLTFNSSLPGYFTNFIKIIQGGETE